ncbi:MAG TPA: methyl-accepting chemotaxis protein, partial [bacterium]|nr:methyl-accepting chemotaxis protein [bacterium]
EKAGDAGRGFAVVAREIRRLADRSAVATIDISRSVAELKSASNAGTARLDDFAAQMRRGLQETARLTALMAEVIDRVSALLPQCGRATEETQAQAQRAEEIAAAMGQLTEAAAQTVAALREMGIAITGLTDTAHTLRDAAARFTLPDPAAGGETR